MWVDVIVANGRTPSDIQVDVFRRGGVTRTIQMTDSSTGESAQANMNEYNAYGHMATAEFLATRLGKKP